MKNHHAILYLDILGYRDHVKSDMQIIVETVKSISLALEMGSKLYLPSIEWNLYSDAFIATKYVEKEEDVIKFYEFCTFFSAHVLQHYPKLLPYRGAVAFGEVKIKEESFRWPEDSEKYIETKEIKFAIGQPIVDAYTLENKLDIIGVVNTDEATKYLKINYPRTLDLLYSKNILINTQIPLNDNTCESLDFVNCYRKEGVTDQLGIRVRLEPAEFHTHEKTRKKFLQTREIFNGIFTRNQAIG
jgi:hypothetical protein